MLAHAGLKRIGRLAEVGEVFDTDQMLPAPGQGSLALECRADRDDLRELLAEVDDAATRRAVTAERTILAVLEAGCSAPVGTYAAEVDEELHLRRPSRRSTEAGRSGCPQAATRMPPSRSAATSRPGCSRRGPTS